MPSLESTPFHVLRYSVRLSHYVLIMGWGVSDEEVDPARTHYCFWNMAIVYLSSSIGRELLAYGYLSFYHLCNFRCKLHEIESEMYHLYCQSKPHLIIDLPVEFSVV